MGCVLPEHTEEFTMPTKKRLWLNKKERLFPSPNHPGQEHQKKPVRLPVNRVFYLSPENDQLVSQQRVFCKEFGFSSGQIGECAKHKGGRRWFNPTQKTFLKRMKAEKYALLDRDEHRQHELNPSFVKIGALEDEYKQNGPCLLYSPLTSFGKEACSIVRNMPIFRTDVLSSQHSRNRPASLPSNSSCSRRPEMESLTSPPVSHAPGRTTAHEKE
jgi:hypothetical protein